MAKWTRENLKAAFEGKGWRIVCIRDIQSGVQFELEEDVKVDLHDSGKSPVRGPQSEFRSEVKDFVDAGPNDTASTSGKSSSERRVFVVYGHDSDAREDLELILRRVKANPIILQNIPANGDTIIEKLESLTDTDYACVLLTPDDVGAEKCESGNPRPRARQNVVLEMGMVLSRLGRKRVAILVKGEEIEKPSDIDGLIYIPFDNKVTEAKTKIGAALKEAGFDIDVRDLDGP